MNNAAALCKLRSIGLEFVMQKTSVLGLLSRYRFPQMLPGDDDRESGTANETRGPSLRGVTMFLDELSWKYGVLYFSR